MKLNYKRLFCYIDLLPIPPFKHFILVFACGSKNRNKNALWIPCGFFRSLPSIGELIKTCILYFHLGKTLLGLYMIYKGTTIYILLPKERKYQENKDFRSCLCVSHDKTARYPRKEYKHGLYLISPSPI